MKDSPNTVFPASTVRLTARNRRAATFATPLSAVLALFAGCGGPGLLPAETALADQMTDCAYLSTRHMLLGNELGVPVEKGYASIGYYKVAGIALSSEAHAARRFDQARTRYFEAEESIVKSAADPAHKLREMSLLEKKLADCSQLSRTHRDFISPRVGAFIAHSK
ncbi:MAG: hypothetical protein ACJ8HI_00750 [Massilia sp.]